MEPSKPTIDKNRTVWNYSLFTDADIIQFKAGSHYKLYELFGSKEQTVKDTHGVYFAVWAPNAALVSVKGEFNDWNEELHVLSPRWDKSGIWEGFIPDIHAGLMYKYFIRSNDGKEFDKGDPFAHYWELRPGTASIIWNLDYSWQDKTWMRKRKKHNSLSAPWSVYELHLASWMRPDPSNEASFNDYEEISNQLIPYLKEMQFTHVEFMPVMEHPYDGSWGYQGTGYFAPTSRFGIPQDFMQLIDRVHQAGFGVVLDWVPSHFPYDAHGLFMFDGSHTYEYADKQKGFHPDWNSYIFNYKRGEVKSFLISNARFWMDVFHADGLRVDAVSSMLKLNYSRNEGEWLPNENGGAENLEAVSFIKDLNDCLYESFPDCQTIAEEATNWPGVTKPTSEGGLGFGMKWMMGWMHDTLDYFRTLPADRPALQDKFSFSIMYGFDEKFQLPLSHDEVVHGKSPMLYKMPGNESQKFANLRLLYTYMFTHPGTKLLFMGNEFGQSAEWNYKTELDWPLLRYDAHKLLKNCLRDLNLLYRREPALYQKQFEQEGFEWLGLQHRQEAVIIYRRKGIKPKDDVVIVLNMSEQHYPIWELTLQGKTNWQLIFNSDSADYWGAGSIKDHTVAKKAINTKTKEYKISFELPPLTALVFK